VGFTGMSVEDIDRAAVLLRGQGQELESVRQQIDRLVREAGMHWDGADLRAFRGTWATVAPKMRTSVDHLADMSKHLVRQADEQRQASAPRPGSITGLPQGPGGSPSDVIEPRPWHSDFEAKLAALGVSPDDAHAIELMVQNAPQPYRDVFEKYVGDVKYATLPPPGNPNYRGPAYYWNGTLWLWTNGQGPDCFAQDGGGPYATFFHEFGHAVDDLSVNGVGNGTEVGATRVGDVHLGPFTLPGRSLDQTMRDDVRTTFTDRLYAQTDPALPEAQRRAQAERLAYTLMVGSNGETTESTESANDWGSVDYSNEFTPADLEVLRKTQAQLDIDVFGPRPLTRGPERTPVLDAQGRPIVVSDVGVSDAYSAMTGNAVVGDWDGDGSADRVGGAWSHEAGYYLSIDDNPNSTVDTLNDGFWPGGARITQGNGATELWGNYFAAQMTGNMDAVDRIANEMPNAAGALTTMAGQM